MRPSGNWVMLRTLFPPKPSVPLIGVKTQYFSAMAGNERNIKNIVDYDTESYSSEQNIEYIATKDEKAKNQIIMMNKK